MRWLGQSHRIVHQLSPNVNPLDTAEGQKALGRIHIVSTLKRNALGRNHSLSTPYECTVQKSHCVNIVEETHGAEITLCQHHRRHSRRGITKNVHYLHVPELVSALLQLRSYGIILLEREDNWDPCPLKPGCATETMERYTLSTPVELRDLSVPCVLDVTSATLKSHLVPSIANSGHRHQGLLHVRHPHVEHTLVALGQHVNVLLTTVGHGPTIRRDVAHSFPAALGNSDLHLRANSSEVTFSDAPESISTRSGRSSRARC